MRRLTFAAALLVQFWALYVPRTPHVDGPELPLDKVVHFALFAGVTWLGLRAGIPAALLVPLMLVQAAASELIQWQLLPQRGGDWWDLLADLVGVGAGWWFYASRTVREPSGSS